MIRPRVGKANDGQIMSLELINGMIARTEYAADLLRQYKLVAGNGMYVEPHYDGTRISYFQPVKGGATPRQPINLFPGFPSETDPEYNASVLIEKYKPGNEPAIPTQEYWQPFIDGVRINVANLIEIYGGNVFLKGTMTGINGQMTAFVSNGPTIIAQFSPGSPGYLRLSAIAGFDVTFALTFYYFGDPPFIPPREFFPAGVAFEIVDSVT
jgi:hypothetical protein